MEIVKSDDFKSLEDEVKYLLDTNMYWKTDAEIILEDTCEGKKKQEKDDLVL